jgi:subtilisin family serine protease
VNISAANRFEPFEIEKMEREIRMLTTGVDANFNPDPNGKRFFFSVIGGNGSNDPQANQCAADGTVVGYPGLLGPSIDGMVTVGAITRNNTVWEFGCDGPAIELLAPGVDMFLASAFANDVYVGSTSPNSGTSFAAPYVAGMAARMLERDPNLTPAQLEARLKTSASRVDGLPVPVMAPQAKRRAVRQ